MSIEINEEVDITHFTENSSFEKYPYLIEFRADWCGPCKQMEDVMDEIEIDYFQQIHVLSVDVDSNKKIPEKYSIRNIPTTILLNAEGLEVDRIVGAVPKKTITDKIELFFEKKIPNIPLFEIVTGRVLTTVRRFVVEKKDYGKTKSWSSLDEGDILEEIFNKPNCFCNITKIEEHGNRSIVVASYLKNYNNIIKNLEHRPEIRISNTYKRASSLIPMDSIDVKDSIVFQKFTKKAVSLYKKSRKKLSEANEDLTILRHILEIENED